MGLDVKIQCDSCPAKVEDRPEEWDKHNAANYVQHVFSNHPDDAERIRIIQSYIKRYTQPKRRT